MRLHIHIRLLQGRGDDDRVTIDEWDATYELSSTPDSVRGLMDRFRTLLRRELINKALITASADDLKRKR